MNCRRYMSDDMHTTYWFDSALVSGLLIAIIAAAALVCIGYTVQQFVIAARKPTIRLLSTGKEPELSLGKGQKWHLFLSHNACGGGKACPRRRARTGPLTD